MGARNPKSPWNPADPPEVSPEEYEKQVVAWLRASARSLDSFEVQHRTHLSGTGGQYEFDGVAELTLFHGARIIVLVECKRYSRPVERAEVQTLWARLQDVKAHKAMMFATCGFQSGALEYARTYGIATIAFVDGEFLYETKAAVPTPDPPPWANLPEFAGILMRYEDGGITSGAISMDNTGAITEWLSR